MNKIVVLEDTNINGFDIKKGTVLNVSGIVKYNTYFGHKQHTNPLVYINNKETELSNVKYTYVNNHQSYYNKYVYVLKDNKLVNINNNNEFTTLKLNKTIKALVAGFKTLSNNDVPYIILNDVEYLLPDKSYILCTEVDNLTNTINEMNEYTLLSQISKSIGFK